MRWAVDGSGGGGGGGGGGCSGCSGGERSCWCCARSLHYVRDYRRIVVAFSSLKEPLLPPTHLPALNPEPHHHLHHIIRKPNRRRRYLPDPNHIVRSHPPLSLPVAFLRNSHHPSSSARLALASSPRSTRSNSTTHNCACQRGHSQAIASSLDLSSFFGKTTKPPPC
ncbi:hypothetical protein FN846DRAFT_573515 [Sphaerosporella brunnea]|uniref:Uncharacterized protein n=1 Tax=Sphaerosporella brunnea TaxID=1250544 RepID=A0A5J5F1P8_9PEZI|nr:hypothetical protein FN846DRAFT_573515 [Sphaerosporella brunnea]